jgi:trehalose synthase
LDYRQHADKLGEIESGRNPLETYTPDRNLQLDQFIPFIGAERVDALKILADPLAGKTWAHVNSTFDGGGVAEMLVSLIPLARSMGLDAQWYSIRGNDDFFGVTKKFHNTLQGLSQPVSLKELYDTYLGMIEENARNTYIHGDLVVVHDPQPAGLLDKGCIFGNVLWRCHIDTSNPDPVVWRFLRPFINQAAGAIFTLPAYVGPGLNVPVYQVMPAIDPLSEKNKQFSKREALSILGSLFHEQNIDPDRPIIAAISRYDPHKNQRRILDAFQLLKQSKSFSKPPYLIFIGNTASDDPEGGKILDDLLEASGDDPDVRILVNVKNNDVVIGAMMAYAEAFVHVSTKEGFGLVVTEAMWQGTPLIGSTAGGITQQVIDGKTGHVIDPFQVEQISSAMARVLENPEEAHTLARQGQEHIRQNFLLPELLRRYFLLMRYHVGIDDQIPDFRITKELTSSEWISGFRRKSVLIK